MISNLRTTKHAATRLQQRGFKSGDVEIIEQFGTPSDDGFLMLGKDADLAIAELKAVISEIERLKNRFIVVKGASIVSAYPTTARKCRRLLKR